MCLEKITAKNRNLSGQGWKVFLQDRDAIRSPIYTAGDAYPLARWIRDESTSYTGVMGGPTYLNGFHIFKRKKDAYDFLRRLNTMWHAVGYGWAHLIIKKVKYHKAHTYGEIDGVKVVVAKEMYIEP